MKRLFVNFTTFAAMATALTFTACSSDSDGDDNGNGNGGNGGGTGSSIVVGENILSGTLTGEQTLDAKEYILNGTVIIADGGRLNIPAGTTIKAREGFSSYLLVAQGGKLYADGTADKPIVFTANTTSPVSGYWGGVIINGKAPISGSKTDKSDTALTEINNDYKYGGSAADDNSGSLTYVKICYAGARSTADIEHNGLTLNGVGNGTKIENIYVLESADDAIEFFGGTVNVTNLLAVNPDDIGFILSSHILGIHRQIRNRPFTSAFSLIPPGHTLGNRILMGTGKRGKYQIPRIGRSFIHLHTGQELVILPDFHNAAEIQAGFHAMAYHVHG